MFTDRPGESRCWTAIDNGHGAGEGALGNKIKEMETVILPLDGDALVYKNKVRIPKKPMIGVIGVASGRR